MHNGGRSYLIFGALPLLFYTDEHLPKNLSPKVSYALYNYSALQKKYCYSVIIGIIICPVSMQICSYFAEGI